MYIYTMEYYSAIKNNEIMSFVVKWMDLKIIIASKWSKSEYQWQILYDIDYMYNLKKHKWTYL